MTQSDPGAEESALLERNAASFLNGKIARGLAAFTVILVSVVILLFGWKLYSKHYETLHSYHVDGLPAILLLSLAIATISTPFFAHSVSEGPDGKPENVKQMVQLYLSVLGIVTTAFSLVLFVLWVLGWLRVLLYVLYRMLLQSIGID